MGVSTMRDVARAPALFFAKLTAIMTTTNLRAYDDVQVFCPCVCWCGRPGLSCPVLSWVSPRTSAATGRRL
jgi:hypothetical protein